MIDLDGHDKVFCKCGHSLAMHHGSLFHCGVKYVDSRGATGYCRCKGYEEIAPPKTWYERLENQ